MDFDTFIHCRKDRQNDGDAITWIKFRDTTLKDEPDIRGNMELMLSLQGS